MIATALAWSLSLPGAPLAAATDTVSAVGGETHGRPLVAQHGTADVAPAEGDVLLNVGAIVTTSEEAAALRVAVGSFEGRRLHIVQFAGPIQPEWYEDLEATGAELIQYIPSFAYLVYGDESALSRVQEMARSSAAVRWDGAYLDGYKIQPAARPETRAGLGLPADQDAFAIQLVADPAANGETVKLVERRAAGGVRQRWEILKYVNLVVTLPLEVVDAIAARPDVVSIDRHVTPQMFDERQDRIVSGQLTGSGPTPGDHLAYLAGKGFTQSQFEASGFVVDVSDSGIDNGTTTPNHFGLRMGGDLANAGRVQYNRLEGTANAGSTLQGCDGHGNLNSHIVAGYVPDPATLPSPATHADASAFRYGLGVCPFVKVGSSVIFDPASYTNPNLPNLQARAYHDNARISTNSWGANAGGAYTVEAQTFDALVRDAQPATSVFPSAGNQEMVVVFSAGNAGPTANTIGSPGVAKNVIAVGASEGVQPFGGTDGCGVGDASADSANDMAIFSSRGPADDGRVKPDIVAPGTHISGGVFQLAASVAGTGTAAACFDGSGVCGGLAPSEFFPAEQQFYSASSGTSHSAPAVAGGTALVRQHFVNNGLTPPSPAMTKAVLVNSARYMNGTGANDTLPSNGQGMGMMNLDAYFSQLAGPRILFDQRSFDLFTASGQQHTITGTVADGGQPLRVTLAWTDAPGPTSGSAYVNNLDLEVTAAGNTYRGNVFAGGTSTTGGSADPRNNVESVFLPAGLSGPFSVRVVATNVAGDGVPGVGGALDQDYALVISNAAEVTQPVVVAGAAMVVADSCGSGNGALDPGEAATVSLCLQNVGTADTTNAVATLLPTGGVTSPGAPQGYGVLTARGQAVCRSFDFVVGSVSCGAAVTPTALVQDGAADLGSVAWTLLTGTPVVPLAEAFDGVTAPALPAGWTTTSEAGADAWATVNTTPDTVPNAAFINDPAAVSLTSLVSPSIAVPATTAPIALAFRHSYALESGYDGAVLEVKIGEGAFQDVLAAGGSFVAGGYNQTLSAAYGNPLGGRPAWSGSSGGYLTTTANLPASASGQTIQLRWRRGSDFSVAGAGWRVDTLSLQAGRTCCTTPIQPSLSIDDVSVVEGDAGTTTATFTVLLSPASSQTVSVSYATAYGTATTVGGDYVAASGALTFDPGVPTRPVSVTVNGDTAVEPNETFFVNLSGATNATIADAQGVGTITNDDLPVSHVLTVTRTGLGSGLVASTPPGIDCGLDCSESYPGGAPVSLTAVPAVGSVLVGWSGGCVGTGLSCDLTMDAAKTAVAEFDFIGEPITWERFIGTEAVSNTLLRPTGTGWNAGAVSNKVLASGDGFAEYTVPATPGYAMFGLSHGDTDGGYADIDYALYTYPVTGQVMVYEKGVYRGTLGSYAQGDRLRVSVEAGVVTYRRNGLLLGSSAVVPTYPLLVDTSLYSAGTELLDARIAGPLEDRVVLGATDVYWRNVVNATAVASTLTRESSVGWNGGASSSQELVSGDGYTEYRVASASDYVMFGLSHGDTDAGYADVDYAIYTYPPTGLVMVYEGGAYRTTLGSYAVNDILRVGVEGGVVTYSVNGVLLYSSSTPPTYPLVTDTSLNSANATVSEAKMGGELKEIVSWTHLNGVEVTGDALTRPVAGGWTAGAISSRRIPTGSGGAEYAVADMASYVMFGLSHGDTDGSYGDIGYALYTYPPTSRVMVYENGAYRGQFGAYAVGDRLRVSVEDGVVSYWKNGGLLYTSLAAPTYPLILDVSLYAGVIQGARLFGNLATPPVIEENVAWTNLVNVTDSGGMLQKPTGSGWNAGAISTQTLAGDGYVEYTVSSLSDYVMFGLGTGDTDQGWADIEYAIYTYPGTGYLYIYEAGVYRAWAGSYAVGDELRVAVEGSVVRYRKNGMLLYSSTVPPAYPLNVDTSLYSTGATVSGAKIGREQ